MPDPIRQQLADRIWAVLEAWAPLADELTESNQIDRSRLGWLREFIANTPADFATVKVDFSQFSHSGWTLNDGFSGEDPEGDDACTFPVIQTGQLVITVTHELPDESGSNAVADEVVNALFVAGPRLGIPDLVIKLGPVDITERDTTGDERPQPGRVITIKQTIETQQDGRTLLAALQE